MLVTLLFSFSLMSDAKCKIPLLIYGQYDHCVNIFSFETLLDS